MNNLYYILAANLIIWLGLFVYLLRTDSRLKKLEDKCRQE
jgi:CcmD family protein